MDNKKSQLQASRNWFIALVLLFVVIFTYFSMAKPTQQVNTAMESYMTESYAGRNLTQEITPKFHKDSARAPILVVGGILLVAFLASLRQDPNYPYE